MVRLISPVILLCTGATLGVPLDGMQTIGSAIKGGKLTTSEQVVFEHSATYGGVINYIWLTGGTTPSTARVRIYVDDDPDLTLDFNFYQAVGIGWQDETAPWGNNVMGKNAKDQAYLTYRIPFGKSVNITLTGETSEAFWFIVRGLEFPQHLPADAIEWGDSSYTMPSTARLHLDKVTNKTMQPFNMTTLASASGSGAVWMVFIQAVSADENFLEACFRFYQGDQQSPMFLSSGTEDFFNSAYYFNVGTFQDALSGLTHNAQDGPDKAWRLGMYRTFDRDPLVFQNGMRLDWRNNERVGMGPGECPNAWKATSDSAIDSAPGTAPMSFSSYVWYYTW